MVLTEAEVLLWESPIWAGRVTKSQESMISQTFKVRVWRVAKTFSGRT